MPIEKDEWDDLLTMFQDMAKYVSETGARIVSADSITSRHFGFSDGTYHWRVSEGRLRRLIAKIPDVRQQNILTNAFASAAGRRALAESFSNVPLWVGPKSRFQRDDVI